MVVRSRRHRRDLLRRCSRGGRSRMRCSARRPSPTPRSGGRSIGVLRCVRRRRRPARASSATCWRGCARPGCWSTPSWPTGSSCKRGAPALQRGAGAGAVGASALAPGHDRPAAEEQRAWAARAARARRRASCSGCSVRPAGARRACSTPTSSTRRRRCQRAGARWASCASSRGSRPSSRQPTRRSWAPGWSAWRSSAGERRARQAGSRRGRSAVAARQARARAVRVRPAGRSLSGAGAPAAVPGRRGAPPAGRDVGPGARRAQDALAAERYLLYAMVSRPEELLVLSWHLADDDGEPTARSLFVDDVCDLFAEGSLEQRARRPTARPHRMWPRRPSLARREPATPDRRATAGRTARARLVGVLAGGVDLVSRALVCRTAARAGGDRPRPRAVRPRRSGPCRAEGHAGGARA